MGILTGIGSVLGTLGESVLKDATSVDLSPTEVINVEVSEAEERMRRNDNATFLVVLLSLIAGFGILGYFITKSK